MRELKINLKGGHVRRFPVLKLEHIDTAVLEYSLQGYSIVSRSHNLNQIRRHLSILSRFEDIGVVDLVLVFSSFHKAYEIWTYTANWAGRACYFAGIITAELRRLRHKKRRKRRGMVSATIMKWRHFPMYNLFIYYDGEPAYIATFNSPAQARMYALMEFPDHLWEAHLQ